MITCKTRLTPLACLIGITTAACGPPPAVGDWESRDTIGGERNELELDEDGRGQATLYFYFGDGFYEADFDVDWEEDSRGDITVDLTCDGNCGDFDFRMDCELTSDESEMECDGEEPFRTYEFEWVKR